MGAKRFLFSGFFKVRNVFLFFSSRFRSFSEFRKKNVFDFFHVLSTTQGGANFFLAPDCFFSVKIVCLFISSRFKPFLAFRKKNIFKIFSFSKHPSGSNKLFLFSVFFSDEKVFFFESIHTIFGIWKKNRIFFMP